MATVKDNPAAQLAYLERKDAALKRKAGNKPGSTTKAGKKDHGNAQLAAKIVASRLDTARRNAAARGIKPAKATAAAGEKPAEK